jgi:anti-anti-sigma factor
MCAELPARPPDFEETVTSGTVIVVLRGEFDVTSEDLLSARLERIRQGRPRRLVFVTTQVAYLDCASARLIAGTGRWLPAGVKPVISSPSPLVSRVLQLSGIAEACDFES